MLRSGVGAGTGAPLLCKINISGITETWAADNLQGEELIGAIIVARALYSPLMRIAEHGGQNGAIIAERIKEKDFNVGYDAQSDRFVDLFEAGIVDPAKVTRAAVQNAASFKKSSLGLQREKARE